MSLGSLPVLGIQPDVLSFSQFTNNLEATHALVMQKDAKGRTRRRRLRFHLFESLGRRHWHVDPASAVPNSSPTSPDPTARDANYHASNDANAAIIDGTYSQNISSDESGEPADELSMKEALALLEGRKFTPVTHNYWWRLSRVEAAFRTPISIYAAKCSAAALVFGSLIWASGSRAFFIRYNITGSLLTVIVAL